MKKVDGLFEHTDQQITSFDLPITKLIEDNMRVGFEDLGSDYIREMLKQKSAAREFIKNLERAESSIAVRDVYGNLDTLMAPIKWEGWTIEQLLIVAYALSETYKHFRLGFVLEHHRRKDILLHDRRKQLEERLFAESG